MQLNWSMLLGDELAYKFMAYNFHSTGFFSGLNELYVATRTPSNLYQFILSYLFYLPFDFYQATKVLNEFMVGILLFWVAFMFSKRRKTGELRIYEVLLLALFPSLHFSGYVLIEPLYYLLTGLWITFVWRVLCQPGVISNYLLVGAVSGLTLNAKPIFIATFGAFLAYLFFLEPASRGRWLVRVRHIAATSLGAGVTSGLLFGLLNRQVNSTGALGSYESHAKAILDFGQILQNSLSVTSTFLSLIGALVVLLLPSFLRILFQRDPVEVSEQDREFNRLLVTVTFFVFSMISVFTMTMKEFHLLHFRYYSNIFPFFALGLISCRSLRINTWWAGGALVFLVASVMVFWQQVGGERAISFSSNFFELSWLFELKTSVFYFGVLISIVLMLVMLRRVKAIQWQKFEYMWVIGIFLTANIYMSKIYLNAERDLNFVLNGPMDCFWRHQEKTVGVLAPSNFGQLINTLRIVFRLDSEVVYVGPLDDTGRIGNLSAVRGDVLLFPILEAEGNTKMPEIPGWQIVSQEKHCVVYKALNISNSSGVHDR